MKIERNIYLDFDDVLIRPQRSDLSSRNEVVLERTITFKHSKKTWHGTDISIKHEYNRDIGNV